MTWISLYETGDSNDVERILALFHKKSHYMEVYSLSRQWTGRKPKVIGFINCDISIKDANEIREHLGYGLLVLKSKPNLRYFNRVL